jgi:hypothetical protein
VRRKLDERRNDSVRFWDTQDIDVGDVWPERLINALRVSRLCLCLLSPGYFNSEYCGKEFQVFKVRHSINKPPGAARAIFPILWELSRGPLPDSVQPYQYSNDDFPSSYVGEGLRYLMKLSKYRDDYVLFVDRLASKLVEAGDATPLPELDDPDRFENVPNAGFRSRPVPENSLREQEADKFERVILERLEDQISWYNRKSLSNQRIYKRIKSAEIIAASVIPFILIGYFPHSAYLVGGLAVSVVLFEGMLHLNQYQQNWTAYRSTCEALKHEKYVYLAHAGPYAGTSNSLALLAERIEGLVSQEHAKWASVKA